MYQPEYLMPILKYKNRYTFKIIFAKLKLFVTIIMNYTRYSNGISIFLNQFSDMASFPLPSNQVEARRAAAAAKTPRRRTNPSPGRVRVRQRLWRRLSSKS